MAPKPTKLPSGNWNTKVRMPDGSRRSITDPLKRVVEQKARELEASFARGVTAVPDEKVTVGEWAVKWFLARRVEPNTAAKNDSHWRNHIRPKWGAWPLAQIDRLDVQAWVNDMADAGIGAPTIGAVYNLLSKILGDAVLSKKLHASPCVEVQLPKVVKPTERWLSRHEYDRIQLALANRALQVARTGRYKPDPQAPMWQAFVALGCFSGLRPGELAGLDVEHLDLERNLARVQQVMTRYGPKPYPKNSASERWVPFPQEVADLLWRWVGDRGSGAVFTSPDGARLDDRNFARRVWAPALEEAGVPACRVYVMRHTAASWLAQAGVSSDEIADILGHSSTRITSTVYRHMRPGVHERVRAAWDGAGAATHVLHTPDNEKAPPAA